MVFPAPQVIGGGGGTVGTPVGAADGGEPVGTTDGALVEGPNDGAAVGGLLGSEVGADVLGDRVGAADGDVGAAVGGAVVGRSVFCATRTQIRAFAPYDPPLPAELVTQVPAPTRPPQPPLEHGRGCAQKHHPGW